MVSESRAYFSEQLNMGELLHREGSPDVTMMNITVKSHVSLIDTRYYSYAESEATNIFVKLIVPKIAAVFSIDQNLADTFPDVSNPTPMPTNVSVRSTEQHDQPIRHSPKAFSAGKSK